jgi:hypothetical protein
MDGGSGFEQQQKNAAAKLPPSKGKHEIEEKVPEVRKPTSNNFQAFIRISGQFILRTLQAYVCSQL